MMLAASATDHTIKASTVDLEAAMAEKSAEFLKGGSELYVGAGGREHD